MKKRILFKVLGFVFCILPPLLAALDQFPLLTTAGKLSMAFVFVAALCVIPLYKYIKVLLKSPSAWVMWLVVFIFCASLRIIIDEFYIISLIGFVGSIIGAAFFKLAKSEKREA